MGKIDEVTANIEKSIKKGNAATLERYLANELELVIDTDRVNFTKINKQHAGQILASFFKKNPPIRFEYLYQGVSSKTERYCVGNYHSFSKDYMIYLLISENTDHSFTIKTMQFREN